MGRKGKKAERQGKKSGRCFPFPLRTCRSDYATALSGVGYAINVFMRCAEEIE